MWYYSLWNHYFLYDLEKQLYILTPSHLGHLHPIYQPWSLTHWLAQAQVNPAWSAMISRWPILKWFFQSPSLLTEYEGANISILPTVGSDSYNTQIPPLKIFLLIFNSHKLFISVPQPKFQSNFHYLYRLQQKNILLQTWLVVYLLRP